MRNDGRDLPAGQNHVELLQIVLDPRPGIQPSILDILRWNRTLPAAQRSLLPLPSESGNPELTLLVLLVEQRSFGIFGFSRSRALDGQDEIVTETCSIFVHRGWRNLSPAKVSEECSADRATSYSTQGHPCKIKCNKSILM